MDSARTAAQLTAAQLARASRSAQNAANAAKAIADRKAQAAQLIAQLQKQLAAIPADGSWANAGDAGYAVEQLTDMVRSLETAYPTR